jgi:hypothetical protein
MIVKSLKGYTTMHVAFIFSTSFSLLNFYSVFAVMGELFTSLQ